MLLQPKELKTILTYNFSTRSPFNVGDSTVFDILVDIPGLRTTEFDKIFALQNPGTLDIEYDPKDGGSKINVVVPN